MRSVGANGRLGGSSVTVLTSCDDTRATELSITLALAADAVPIVAGVAAAELERVISKSSRHTLTDEACSEGVASRYCSRVVALRRLALSPAPALCGPGSLST